MGYEKKYVKIEESFKEKKDGEKCAFKHKYLSVCYYSLIDNNNNNQ